MAKGQIVFFDFEINPEKAKILAIGCIRSDEAIFNRNDLSGFVEFIKHADFLCGHNILSHDLEYLQKHKGEPGFGRERVIDTLLLSPLLFPQNPYHKLLKDDQLQTEELNNPVNDAKKARDLFYDEEYAFRHLPEEFKAILYGLLYKITGFSCFFKYIGYTPSAIEGILENKIHDVFRNKICQNCDVQYFVHKSPVSLAYALALLNCHDRYSITPPWVLKNYPEVESILCLLRNSPCVSECDYCEKALNPIIALKKYFDFSSFRSYGEEPLQENAIIAAMHGKSILAVFPTGGGKSITFQVPALISGENAKALTVVISPLQSLMKDQIDNLEKKDITEAVTINGLLDPIERSKAIERIEKGYVSLLYISPESLRSVTIERLLLKRNIARFVIDEAHCFSSWGQDFRVDYLYIGEFIKNLQRDKKLKYPIPISCFTATAKQKVVEDIQAYFKEKLALTLEVFRSNATRTNLHYRVFREDNDDEKYSNLRNLIESNDRPTIVYVSRTKKAYRLAQRLSDDGLDAKPYHGKMNKQEKSANQDAFKAGEVKIIVATSAFGMGVDKRDVGCVIHYDISDSLENYVQESGRAGRDESIEADCYILFNEEDLDSHFSLLNQTKISIEEINQVWKAIKGITKFRDKVSNSALEIARKAGWDEGIKEIETRVTTAIAALEDAGYLKRGQNMPRIFANSILSKNAQEAIDRITVSEKFNKSQKENATRIIKKLFSSKSKRLSTDEIAESRIDYISDQLGIVKEDVIRIVELLQEDKILAQTKDLTAFIKQGEHVNRSLSVVESYRKQEEFFLSILKEDESTYNLKEINEQLVESGIKDSAPNKLKTIINFWAIKNWIKRHNVEHSRHYVQMEFKIPKDEFKDKLIKRHFLAKLITEYLYKKSVELKPAGDTSEDVLIEFSVQELKEDAEKQQGMFNIDISIDDIEDTLFYLSRIEAIKIEGGFLVIYNKLSIERLIKDNRIQYKKDDYENLRLFYQQKVQQIHIVGEYAKKMIQNYKDALQFADDYFGLNYSSFLSKYFPGTRLDEINRTLTPEKFSRLFGDLSPEQLEIINDSKNKNIVVSAGPGSGKTRVLVHKLASLLLAEDVKHEQLLMLTFSRAAATEFKKRLLELIANTANFIEIKTFHSYCFDLLGRVGSLSQADLVVKMAVEKVKSGDIETNRITKTVLVVDEAQDMNMDEFDLVKVLMEQNNDMRVIFVGDDDQNIYGFRGSDSKYMQQLISTAGSKKYELIENYRSKDNIVDFANQWAEKIQNRLKEFPCFAKQHEDGEINIVEYSGQNLIVPITNSISQLTLTGSSCVLTKTNEEAVEITGLLIQNGRSAKLIQTNDGFSLSNLYEVRYFSELLNSNADSPLINNEDWRKANDQFILDLRESTNLELVNNIIKQFEITNPVRKYRSDWRTFLLESKIEDFVNIESGTIYVSTIHKAKGKEFENVFIMLRNFKPNGDENIRQLYVALTRAKSNLFIHYNDNYLKPLIVRNRFYVNDRSEYSEPKIMSVYLTHRDVQLGYFEFVQWRMRGLKSGSTLTIMEEGLGNGSGELILKFSQKFKAALSERQQKGYRIASSIINYIVYWKDENKESEVLVILPIINLVREI